MSGVVFVDQRRCRCIRRRGCGGSVRKKRGSVDRVNEAVAVVRVTINDDNIVGFFINRCGARKGVIVAVVGGVTEVVAELGGGSLPGHFGL